MSDDSSSEDEDKFQVGQVHNPRGSTPRQSSDTSYIDEEIPTYEKPNYAAAMEYWNTLLPRRIKDPSQPSGYRQALVGELFDENGEPAELYDFFKTDSAALDEFGIGMSLYFRTLKIMSVTCLICALILLVSVGENKRNQENIGWFGDNGLEEVEETIGTCYVSYDTSTDKYIFDRNTTNDKLSVPWNLLGSVYGATPQSLKFSKQGVADLVMFAICFVLMVLASRLEKKEVENIDIAQQTTQDYSIVVTNPPANVTSDQEYYEFFSKFGEVVTLTVALRNGGLMKTIADRKMLSMKVESMRQFEAMKSPEELQKEPTSVDKLLKLLGMDLESCETKLEHLDKRILALSNADYVPWRVFVSFNKEEEQRKCLAELAKSDFKEVRNFLRRFEFLDFLIESEKEKELFHGVELDVSEAPEPTDVIYEHNHRTEAEVICRLAVSYFLTGFAVFCVMLVIIELQDVEGTIAQVLVALFISGMNAGLPVGIRMLTQIVEAHSSETDSQRSVLLKLIVARCMNSAVLIYVLTPWHSQFSLENMRQIQFILLSDAVVAPMVRFLNLWDVFKRRFIAPVIFGKTQAGYNSQFQGTKWTLAERYTDALKSVFAGFFFAVPLPTGLFISSFAMITTYMVDKYALMRLWERKPTIDHSLAKMTRYFLIATLWAHLYLSMIYFTNWPYSYGGLPEEDSCDNNCENCPNRQDIECDYVGFFCRADRSYMTASQYTTVRAFFVLSLVIGICIIFFFLFFRTTKKLISKMLAETKEVGDASDIPLRDVFGAPAYVPTIKLKQMTAPFVFSDISKLPVRFSPVRQNAGWDESIDPKNFSLVDPTYYPKVRDIHFKAMFSTTSFYESKDIFGRLAQSDSDSSDSECDSVDNERGIEMKAKKAHGENHHITEEDFKTSSFMDTASLPSGWERRITTDGRIFYVDHNQMKITYICPVPKVCSGPSFRLSKDPMLSNSMRFGGSQRKFRDESMKKQQSAIVSDVGMPAGWEMRFTASGKAYYVDHNTRKTHWQLPDEINADDSSGLLATEDNSQL